jgi:FkbM family methyltransferase
MGGAGSVIVDRVRGLVRSFGFDVVRYPNPIPSTYSHTLALLAQERVDCVVDVGAHWGEFGSDLRAVGYDGDLVSFEPVRESFRRLEQRSAADPRWQTRQLALGRVEGTAEINVANDSDLSSFLETSSYARDLFPAASVIARQETVEVRRLDALVDDFAETRAPKRLFLKIDTQGFDLQVVAGAQGCLDRVVGLQVETSVKPIYAGMPSYLSALADLEEQGFELTGLFPIQRDGLLRVVEIDCVFRRSPRRAR